MQDKMDRVEKSNEINGQDINFKQKILLIILGSLVGLINGLLGGGGGVICVYLLEKVLHLPSKYSHATAIVIILPISFVSSIVYSLNGSIEIFPFFSVGFGVLCGGILGAFLLKILPTKIIRFIFSIVLFIGGIRLFI